jgi:tetratricopeptide (TPR) repeat protein
MRRIARPGVVALLGVLLGVLALPDFGPGAGAQPREAAPPTPPQAAPQTAPQTAGPAKPPADRASQHKAERRAALDALFEALAKAENEEAAAPIEAKIRRALTDASTPAVTLLMTRGARALQGGENEEAATIFSDALVLDPELAEAWHLLGVARFGAGDLGGAVAALNEAVRREPRHFAAYESLARIAEAREDWEGAYRAWQKALEIAPKLSGGQERLNELKRRALGEET